MSTTTRPMTKSALAVARQALEAARAAVPAYSSKFAKKTYTQHQLLAALAVRQFLKTDYRGVEPHLRDWAELRSALGFRADVPDHSTLQKAAGRLLEKKGPMPSSTRPSRPAAGCSPRSPGRPSTRPDWRPGTPAGATTCGPGRRPAGPGGRRSRR